MAKKKGSALRGLFYVVILWKNLENLDELNVKDEGCKRRNVTAGTTFAIRKVVRYEETVLCAF